MGSFTLATRTLDAINACLEADQGSRYRGFLGKVIPHIGDAYRTDEDGFRSHMGSSLIGGECGRAIWYGFRWFTKKKFRGQLLRLFNRGHLEEARFIALLLSIGCEVFQQDENGKQFRISHASGHFGGSGDGVIVNLPDLAPGTPALGEFKTHNDKSFKELVLKGVREAKFQHYVQMQTYMAKMGLAVGLYMGVNKNDDHIHAELITLDTSIAAQFFDRAEKLVWMETPPPKISNSPGFYKCTFCDHRPVCHLKAEPDFNCRTCAYSAPIENAQWFCSHPGKNEVIDKQTQLNGCDTYSYRVVK